MNPLVVFSLLIAAANAGVIGTPAATTILAAQPAATVLAAQPAATLLSAPAATVLSAQTISVPLTKTIHYASQPVVTGYSTQILKAPLAAAVAGLQNAQISIPETRQIPDLPQPPSTPPSLGDSPIGNTPQLPPIQPPTENGTSDLPVPGSPFLFLSNNINLVQLVHPFSLAPQVLSVAAAPQVLAKTVVAAPQLVAPAPIAKAVVAAPQVLAAPIAKTVVASAPVAYAGQLIQYTAAPLSVAAPAPVVAAPVVAAVRQAQAADFEPLVTKEKVLAPVRTHTQITPQLTQIQPEITVRKVVQEVNVPVVSHIQTPVIQKVALQAPVIQTLASPAIAQVAQLSTVAQAPAGTAQIIQAA